MQNIIDEVTRLTGAYIPSLVAALAILILGWLIALAVSAVVRAALRRTTLDNKIAKLIVGEEKAETIEIEKGVAKGVFYLLMLFVIVAFFQTLGITLITEPLTMLLNELFVYAPKILGAGIILLVAWVIATLLRQGITRGLGMTKLDEKLGKQAGFEEKQHLPLTKSLGDAAYWLVFLLFLPAVLSTLNMEGILRPVQGMLNKVLEFLPNILTAAIIFILGWFIARIVQKIVTSLLTAAGAEKLGEKAGLSKVMGDKGISSIIGIVVYVFILIPVIIAALNALALDAITQPASNMLNIIFGALPALFAAALILIIAYAVGRLLSGLVTNLLASVGFNNLFVWLGLKKEVSEGKQSPSGIVGSLVLIATMLFAAIEASRLIGFTEFAGLISQFLVFGSHIIFGLAIFAVGLYIANLIAQKILTTENAQAAMLALAARVSIMVLAGAMALRQMGLANEIITLAFGLMLGAIAVAVAIAFGIGGRELAARKLEEWSKSSKSK